MGQFILLLLGVYLVYRIINAIANGAQGSSNIPCNEIRQGHDWEWVTFEHGVERLKCSKCDRIFGQD